MGQLGQDEAWAPQAEGQSDDHVESDLPPPEADD
jgi:hypothetical protein